MIGKVQAVDPSEITFGATADGRVCHELCGEMVWVLDLETAENIAERLDAAINAAYRLRAPPRAAAADPYRSVNQWDEE
jgi:hypothetical protein